MNALIILFYRIVPFFTSIPRKTRDNHFKLYSENPIKNIDSNDGFIRSQENLDEFPYGNGNMFKNGCGPIALYNALISLKKSNDTDIDYKSIFSSIIYYLEKGGLALYGKFGTSPFVIQKFLKKSGFITKIITSNKEKNINEFAKSFDTFISVIYNNSSSIKYGIHIISITKNENGSYTSYNPYTTGATLYDTLSNCSLNRLKNVCTIGIKRTK